MSKFVTTKLGTELPLLDLKGKSYMQVAHRLVWFVEENPKFHIDTELPVLDADKATAKVTIKVFDEQGNIVRKAQDMKTEHTKHFADFMEKAITGAMGRALSQLGYGTAYALADLDEGARIVDAPQSSVTATISTTEGKVVKGSFNQDKKTESDW